MYREINKKISAGATSGAPSQASGSRGTTSQAIRPVAKKSRQVANNGPQVQRQSHQTPQRQPVINISTSAYSLPISNAPTSLANLAQMNGFTMMPLSSTPISSQPNHSRNSNNKNQANRASPTSNNQPRQPSAIPYSLTNLINQTKQGSSKHRGQEPRVSIPNQTARSTSNQQYNSLPNIQSPTDPLSTIGCPKDLSQPVNASVMINLPSNNRQKSIESSSIARASNQPASRRQKFFDNLNSKNNNNSSQKSIERQQHDARNTTHILPISNGSTTLSQQLAHSQPTQSTSFRDLPTPVSLRSMVDDANAESDGYIDNVSLMKLMAIFNNPALTITAVSGPAAKTCDYSRGSNLDDKRLTDLEPKSRLPQSAANIQSVHSVKALSNAANHLSKDQHAKINQHTPPRTESTVSVQLLKHIADQSDENSWTNQPPQLPRQSKNLESDCLVDNNVRKNIPQLLSKPAKQVEICKYVISKNSYKRKTSAKPLQTTIHNLYIPRSNSHSNGELSSQLNNDLNDIAIEESGMKESFVSDQHLMLESMMSDENNVRSSNSMSEPDDIFINRSKRVMSLIDTMVERKRRKRFERISGRSESEANQSNNRTDSQDDTDDEWSSDEGQDYVNFIRTQIPLEEIESEEKRNHMRSIGLVSRCSKNKILLDQCEERSKIFTPLVEQEPMIVPTELQQFIDTILKTGGENVQMRIDSNIKRNDLPLIEGLNKNTSRMKMIYMNVLGLEKRSKRTTLYKIEKRPVCREIIKPPKKNEYMRSLGLVAS